MFLLVSVLPPNNLNEDKIYKYGQEDLSSKTGLHLLTSPWFYTLVGALI